MSTTPMQIDIGLGQYNAFTKRLLAHLPQRDRILEASAVRILRDPASDITVSIPLNAESVQEDPALSGMKGIFRIDGCRLVYCWALPGMPRPTEFTAASGCNQTLVHLERFIEAEAKIERQRVATGFALRRERRNSNTLLRLRAREPTTMLHLAPGFLQLRLAARSQRVRAADVFAKFARVEAPQPFELIQASMQPVLSENRPSANLDALFLSTATISYELKKGVGELSATDYIHLATNVP